MGNLDLYEKVREVPANAQKPITGGRLKDKTDINPMWRLKTLTEQFGVCGIGWKYEIVDKHIVPGANDEMCAFVDINLYIKVNSEWSEAIPGTGGSAFVAKEKGGLYTNDECYKMALTDAISVACKALGIGADVYWDKDKTKYTNENTVAEEKPLSKPKTSVTEDDINDIMDAAGEDIKLVTAVINELGFKNGGELLRNGTKNDVKNIKDKISERLGGKLPWE